MNQLGSKISDRRAYWLPALRFYARAAFFQSAVIWATALVLPPLLWLLHGLQPAAVRGMLGAIAVGVGVGGAFFLGGLGTAIAYDLKRNWHQSEPILEWNPLLFWKVFLYAGSAMFLAFSFFAYRQGWWLSLEFGGFAILCWFAARSMAARVLLPKLSPSNAPKISDFVSHEHRPKHWAGGHLHAGFVGMEYFALILNRSFLVFITDDGLHGWRFHGWVSSLEPGFYEPVEALLDSPDMMPGAQPFDQLMRQPHTFSIPYREIASVEFIDHQKWGMGGIRYSGRLRLRLCGRRRWREFILLGDARGQIIRDSIAVRIQPY